MTKTAAELRSQVQNVPYHRFRFIKHFNTKDETQNARFARY